MAELGREAPEARARRRQQWRERMIAKYPPLRAFDDQGVPKLRSPPSKPPRGPFKPAEVIAGLEANIREAAERLGYWAEQLAEFRRYPMSGGHDSDEEWELHLLGGMHSRYRAEQQHWREYRDNWRARA